MQFPRGFGSFCGHNRIRFDAYPVCVFFAGQALAGLDLSNSSLVKFRDPAFANDGETITLSGQRQGWQDHLHTDLLNFCKDRCGEDSIWGEEVTVQCAARENFVQLRNALARANTTDHTRLVMFSAGFGVSLFDLLQVDEDSEEILGQFFSSSIDPPDWECTWKGRWWTVWRCANAHYSRLARSLTFNRAKVFPLAMSILIFSPGGTGWPGWGGSACVCI